jgi:hypothetical protein
MKQDELLRQARQISVKRRLQKITNANSADLGCLSIKTAELSAGLEKLSRILSRLSERDQQSVMLALVEEMDFLVFSFQLSAAEIAAEPKIQEAMENGDMESFRNAIDQGLGMVFR